jgi:hypothetical protein
MHEVEVDEKVSNTVNLSVFKFLEDTKGENERTNGVAS